MVGMQVFLFLHLLRNSVHDAVIVCIVNKLNDSHSTLYINWGCMSRLLHIHANLVPLPPMSASSCVNCIICLYLLWLCTPNTKCKIECACLNVEVSGNTPCLPISFRREAEDFP